MNKELKRLLKDKDEAYTSYLNAYADYRLTEAALNEYFLPILAQFGITGGVQFEFHVNNNGSVTLEYSRSVRGSVNSNLIDIPEAVINSDDPVEAARYFVAQRIDDEKKRKIASLQEEIDERQRQMEELKK